MIPRILLFLVCVSISGTKLSALPFSSGEKLEYDLNWGFIPVGEATLEILETNFNGFKAWEIKFFVRTNDFADAFYKVRTKAVSLVDGNFTRTFMYKKSQKEGKTQKEIVVDFDYENQKSLYVENDSKALEKSITGNVFDPLAITYAFRKIPVKKGDERILPTCDGKKSLSVLVKVVAEESINVPFGSFNAYDARPQIKNLSGVFKKSPKGMLRVWYTSDNRMIPIKISSKVVVGSFTAKLRRATNLNRLAKD
jgi:hypothetical protein